jgi:pyruvate-formate lyase
LHRGINSFSHYAECEDVGDPAEFKTFEELFEAYESILKPICEAMAYHEQLNYEVAGEEACFLHYSLLTHDCMEMNKPIFSGGCRFLTASSEIFGLITCADSLMAIKHCVYDKKIFTLPEIIKMCDANFEGYEKERNILLNAPKYGNDDEEADNMVIHVFNHMADLHEEAGKHTNLYRYKIVSVNNSGSAERGARTSATPCGRKAGQALSNGNSPSLGADKTGLTATLNSMAKIDPVRHAGVIHNIRFNKELLKNNMDKIKIVLETFYANNGVQTNLSSIGKDDLEQALLYPERYQNLIVRIGGFSARYVQLSPEIQQEILHRTTYEEI